MDSDRIERAWAAGFFDGEGWAGRSGRQVRAQVNQAGPDGVPEVLSRFQRAVGVGRITGPALKEGREPLYSWIATSRGDVAATLNAISPWLGEVKRREFSDALRTEVRGDTWSDATLHEKLGWAAGLFDGEGWTGLFEYSSRPGDYSVEMGIT